jgi:hypothetical protein
MARFYGMLKGRARTITTRLGTEKSGLWASINGWNIGVFVECLADGDKDIIRIYKTDGSNGTGIGELIAEIKR